MRHVSAALVVLVIGACGKGAERSQPAPVGSAAAPTPAPRPRDVPATVALPQLGGDAFLESVPVLSAPVREACAEGAPAGATDLDW